MRLDKYLASKKIVFSRSQAESYIRMGKVYVNGEQISKPGYLVAEGSIVQLKTNVQYVSRAAYKLESVVSSLKVYFTDKTVLDVGSSTGGFTDFALKHGAKKVVAVEVGTNQLHYSLRDEPKIELYEQTDIRSIKKLKSVPDVVVIDVSFISLREILPSVAKLVNKRTEILAMVKPQFESKELSQKHKGVIKNETERRKIFKDFEIWTKQNFFIQAKQDSSVAGEKGNKERFYLLRKL